jgi:two-component system, OmpR family, sensor kinase
VISIRRRLLAALLGALLVAGLIAAVATYLSARDEVDALLDEELRQVALSLRDHSQLDLARLERASHDPELRVLVQIWDPAFTRPYSSRVADPLPRQTTEGYVTLESAGRAWRVYTALSSKQTIQVAQPTALRTELAVRTAGRLLAPVLIVLPFLGLFGWWIVGRGLAPLAAVADTLARRDPTSLDPIAADDLPIEVRPLVDSLNGLLVRLGHAFETQRRFAADAAHELRSPLTALMLQVSLAERAKTPEERATAFARVEQGVQRASRLVRQLLTMARLDPDAAERPSRPVDLSLIAASTVEELRPLADAKAIRLGVDSEPAWLNGQEDALQILVANLVDNAIRHTPQGGRIDIRVSRNGGAVLSVADTGPGVPPDERARVFDRFYRGRDAPAGGSGLGLAIVQQIAQMHGGSVELGEPGTGGGLLVRARFPAFDPSSEAPESPRTLSSA